METKQRYILIVGNLFTGYNGTPSCTGLYVFGKYETLEEMRIAASDAYDTVSDLMIGIDLETGSEVTDYSPLPLVHL